MASLTIRAENFMDPKDVLDAIAFEFNVSVEGILSPSKMKCFFTPRQMAYLIMREEMEMPLKSIGIILNRDHTTVSSGIETGNWRATRDQDFISKRSNILTRLYRLSHPHKVAAE